MPAPALAATDPDTSTSTSSEVVVTGIKESLQRAISIKRTAINQVDHILIGRLPASESVPGHAALGISLILLWAVGGSLSAISVGTQALTARRFGEGARERAGQVMTDSLVVALVTSVARARAKLHGRSHSVPGRKRS